MAERPLVLIVDDEKEFADNLGELIKNTGRYEPIVTYSALDALKILEANKTFLGLFTNRIKLIFLDIKMPGMDGLEFLGRIRSNAHTQRIGVIILTAWEDSEKWEKAREGRVAGYLKKPFKEDELIEAIDRFFSGKHEWMIEQTKWQTLAKETKLNNPE